MTDSIRNEPPLNGAEPSQKDTPTQPFDEVVTNWQIPPAAIRILRRLVEGNRRFLRGELQHPNKDQATRIRLTQGQDPEVILVTCSDSRVDYNSVFDFGLGDVFAIENAGELVIAAGQGASLDMASIEYMVKHYVDSHRCGILLVLGHTDCGAVSAALTHSAGISVGSPHLDLLLDSVRANIPEDVQQQPGLALEQATKANASAVLNSILEHSEIVRAAQAGGHLVVVQATYILETGEVRFLCGIEKLSVV